MAGWSMGSLVLWKYVEKFGRDQALGMVFVGQSASDLRSEKYPYGIVTEQQFFEMMQALQTDQAGTVRTWMQALRMQATPEQVDWMANEYLRCPTDIATLAFYFQTMVDCFDAFKLIDFPTRVFFGVDDKMYSLKDGEYLAQAIPGTKLVVFEQSGHVPMLEEPDKFNQELDAFAPGGVHRPLIGQARTSEGAADGAGRSSSAVLRSGGSDLAHRWSCRLPERGVPGIHCRLRACLKRWKALVTIRTALTEAFGLDYPIVLAPMGGVAGGRLAAAVSNTGGLGLVGGGYGDPGWLRTELELARTAARRPWGVGLITWHASQEAVDLALSYKPDAFMLSFGDVRPYAPAIKAAGCPLICQVQGIEAAREAVVAGADFVVAQGTEARWPRCRARHTAARARGGRRGRPASRPGGRRDRRRTRPGRRARAGRPRRHDRHPLLRRDRVARPRARPRSYRRLPGRRRRPHPRVRHRSRVSLARAVHRPRPAQQLLRPLARPRGPSSRLPSTPRRPPSGAPSRRAISTPR